MTVLYLLATALCFMVILLLASIIPLPVRTGRATRPGLWSFLSFLWHAALVVGCAYAIYRTAVGVDRALLPLVLFAFAPGGAVAAVRIGLGAHEIKKIQDAKEKGS